jgi:hypothetical protein
MRKHPATSLHLQKWLKLSQFMDLQVLKGGVLMGVLEEEGLDVFECGLVPVNERKDCLKFDLIEMQAISICLGAIGPTSIELSATLSFSKRGHPTSLRLITVNR